LASIRVIGGRALNVNKEQTAGHHFFLAYMKADPVFDFLRTDAQYQGLLQRNGLPD
jgi:hypothetical protein